MNITKITALTPEKAMCSDCASTSSAMPVAPMNAEPSHEYSIQRAKLSLPVGFSRGAASGCFCVSSSTASSSRGLSHARTNGMASSIAMVGTRLKPVNTVALNGSTSPVIFCTTFIALPGVDCASAIELEMPLAHTTHPEKPAATIHAKSTRMRFATSRASNALTTSPKPQLQNDATATSTKVSVAACTGVRATETSDLNTRCTMGA